ncbi:NAD(P)/FAD-dependent oxidoreductase [Aquisalimonas asiatica]|uniref:Rubredoxin-NAD+ reductase n=1 Tax=Aquisalimonas asiatica TaxID=406100 RepID=A0A1H8U267_9GAMM|nr:FAD-dependent oxidoreductase [Aquisalimonas asiatica]SEO97362.1 rubredoxin-NAD+ reductase [Aquisalimonas asiatica]
MSIVIVGTGLAGYNTAKAFRKQDSDTPLTLVTADSGRSYSKPMLSTGLRKQQTPADLVQAGPQDMAAELDARVITDSRVVAIDRRGQCVQLASGDSIGYHRLVLATGADPIAPRLDGDAAGRVLQVNDLDQYEVFRDAVADASRVLIMGGGLIGCEFANDLAEAGYSVDLVFPEDAPLPRLLPERPARALQTALEGLGVRVHTGVTLDAVNGAGDGVVARLSDGRELGADVVLAAIGLRPRTALAEEAGLRVAQGISVDRHLATSDPAIHALGDCAEVDGYVLPYVAPLNNAARAVGATLAGDTTAVTYPVMPVMVKTSCCQVVAWPPPEGVAGAWQGDGDGRDLRGEFRDADGVLRGFYLTGSRIRERMAVTRDMPPLLGDQ